MPWRDTRDPYRIWVSEVMLQQTRVATVIPYYERFLAKFPDVRSLANARPDDVMKAWEGLGYYSRARNLHKAAEIVVARYSGELPSAVESLSALPGIGLSTAGAIAAIAFDADAPVLDANAKRVVARLFSVMGDPAAAAVEKALWERSALLVRKGRGRDTALAVMDLGATVCLPRVPRCGVCPLRSVCRAFRRGLQEEIPPKRTKKPVPHREVAAAVFRRSDGALFLMRRPPRGLLGGLWALPSCERGPGETLENALRHALREKLRTRAVIQRKLGAVRHAYTHYRITLHGFLCEPEGSSLPEGERTGWLSRSTADRFAVPRADRKLLEILDEGENR